MAISREGMFPLSSRVVAGQRRKYLSAWIGAELGGRGVGYIAAGYGVWTE